MNRLSRETSPYLLQHADNPVDWYPWGEEAFEKAKALNKPILLSIGYSACHWCHVMAHESFEDKETAELMNRLFVNIKVDREERPDLDKIYQTALQVLIRKPGGWPLTMFLTPDKGIPFFGGTYFPKRAGFGWLGFQQVLQSVADYFQEHSNEIHQFARELQQALQQSTETTLDKNLKFSPELIQVARRSYAYEFDRVHGGFGGAPKFPLSSRLERLLELGDKEALSMVVYSLEKMAKGGIYDHLGGGFCRYSVDEAWMIPHFEKMLYDNAQLLSLYAYAAIATNRRLFKKVAVATGQWIIREMQSTEGGYYSTISADSEGKEGKFYYWDRDEIKNILTADEYAFAEKYFGLALPQNFEGHWHLWIAEDLGRVASDLNIDRKKALRLRKKIISTLYRVRDKRIHPVCDKKILTSWNALAIKGLNIAGRLLKQPDFIDSADKALDFIHRNLWREQRLLVTHKDGRAHLMAYLDDYAFMLDALLQSLQTRWSNQNCKLAIQVAEVLCRYFYDEEHGGFYFTANDHETLIYRPKPVIDDAMPAGNGVAASALLRLGYLLGNTHYLEVAHRTLQMAWEKMSEYPTSCDSLFLALEEYLTPVTIIILRGEADVLVSWQKVFFSYYLPHHLCFSIPNDAEDLPEALQKPINEKGVSAYICQGWECQKTLHFLESFERFLLLLSRAG